MIGIKEECSTSADQKVSATPYQGHGKKILEMCQIPGGIQFRLSVRPKSVCDSISRTWRKDIGNVSNSWG